MTNIDTTPEAIDETEATVLDLTLLGEVIEELTQTLTDENTAFTVATQINKVFKAVGHDRVIPTQMMYNYTRNGMIVKGKKGSGATIRYTKEEVQTYVLKYTRKQLGL
jgi:hypothetical protein